MKNNNKLLSEIIMLAIILSTIALFASCTNGKNANETKNIDEVANGDETKVSEAQTTNVDLYTLWFNEKTVFPESAITVIPSDIMENGKNPGLGVRSINEQSITGMA